MPEAAAIPPLPLSGITVLEIAGGAAAAYCGRLLADAGARVSSIALGEDQRSAGIVRADLPTEHAYAAYLTAGKQTLPVCTGAQDLAALCRQADVVRVGEAAGLAGSTPTPAQIATVALSWFGPRGRRKHWRGNDLVVQALTGLPQMAGTVAGPPLAARDRQATTLAGVTAYIATCAAVLAQPAAQGAAQHCLLDISILDANLVLAEMHLYFYQRDGIALQRWGINRFAPNSPVGIYPCQDGHVGITVSRPDPWRALCQALGLHAQAADAQLATRELRFARLDEVEQVLCQALSHKTAVQWAAVGRQYRVPIVLVPDAPGILSHPVFAARQSLCPLALGDATVQVPRTPFALSASPVRHRLLPAEPAELAPAARASRLSKASEPVEPARAAALAPAADLAGQGGANGLPGPPATPAHPAPPSPPAPQSTAALPPAPPPLHGVTPVDFSMGWAGPLASRLMGDMGATGIKIEAGRYPDWWRGMNWTPEFIAERQYKLATIFAGLNRGKQGVSLGLTTDAGQQLTLALVAGADAVVENQAAGVMDKFGQGYGRLAQTRPDVVMLSMSAFGTGNAWSDTRAYGFALKQGSGLPSFTGQPGTPPTMTHLAQGDPVGGLYGCAALLTALVYRSRGGTGQSSTPAWSRRCCN